jgi:Xaa-Pro dipeptidase
MHGKTSTLMHFIPESDYRKRLSVLSSIMDKRNLGGVFLSNPTNMKYFSGMNYIQTERPAGLFVTREAEVYFMGPKLEEEHSMFLSSVITNSYSYFDYPGKIHPFKQFSRWFYELNGSKNLGLDSTSLYPSVYGFKGIPMSEIMDEGKIVDISSSLSDIRRIKSENEQSVLRESAKWANYAHRLLQNYTEPGLFDFQIAHRASSDACLAAMNAFGRDNQPQIRYPIDISAGFRGQVGTHSYYPHSLSINRPIKKDDLLGSGADGNIDGYHVEIERNLFVGKVTTQMRKYHGMMEEMQQTAISALKIGSKFSDIDRVVNAYAKINEVSQLLLHHSGHCIGLEGHESPFFDVGDDSLIRENMVFTVEPGLYIPRLGGFRHSDTIIMHKDGPELITYYPRDIDDLVID